MKNLENKIYDSKKEMEILDALEEVKQMNKRLQSFNHDKMLIDLIKKGE